MYTNGHYIHAPGCPQTSPFPWFLCLQGLVSHPPQGTPCRLGEWGQLGQGPPSKHCCPPLRDPSLRVSLPGGVGHPRPSSPRHLHQEPQQRDAISFCTYFSSQGRQNRSLLSGLLLPGSQRCSGSRPVRPRDPAPGTQGGHVHHTGNGLDFPGDRSPSLRLRAAASSGWSLGG